MKEEAGGIAGGSSLGPLLLLEQLITNARSRPIANKNLKHFVMIISRFKENSILKTKIPMDSIIRHPVQP
jgi:hypothetical protein